MFDLLSYNACRIKSYTLPKGMLQILQKRILHCTIHHNLYLTSCKLQQGWHVFIESIFLILCSPSAIISIPARKWGLVLKESESTSRRWPLAAGKGGHLGTWLPCMEKSRYLFENYLKHTIQTIQRPLERSRQMNSWVGQSSPYVTSNQDKV